MPVAAVASSSTRAACLSSAGGRVRRSGSERVSATADASSPVAEKPLTSWIWPGRGYTSWAALRTRACRLGGGCPRSVPKSPLRYPRDRLASRRVARQSARSARHALFRSALGAREPVAPFVGNDPRFSPVRRRQLAYFPVRDVHRNSQMLWRSAPDAKRLPRPRRRARPRRFGPCQPFLSYASSNDPEKERELGEVFGFIGQRAARRPRKLVVPRRRLGTALLGASASFRRASPRRRRTKRSRRRSTNRTAQIAQSEPHEQTLHGFSTRVHTRSRPVAASMMRTTFAGRVPREDLSRSRCAGVEKTVLGLRQSPVSRARSLAKEAVPFARQTKLTDGERSSARVVGPDGACRRATPERVCSRTRTCEATSRHRPPLRIQVSGDVVVAHELWSKTFSRSGPRG